MRADILHAQACIDWAVGKFPAIQREIDAWIGENIYVEVRDEPVPSAHAIVVACEKQSLPLWFNVEIGAHINAIRSSLDLLATALLSRNRVSKNAEAHFPIYRSQQDFIDPVDGLEGIKWLSKAEKSIIKPLEPYEGGNALLWSLHQSDILRKHRRLLEVAVQPGTFRVSGFGVSPITPVWRRENDETIIAKIAKGAACDKLSVTTFIAINEPFVERMPVLNTLMRYASLAQDIIALFDAP